MKILYVTHYSAMYGANLSLLNMIKQIKLMSNYDITVLAPSKGPLQDYLVKIGVENLILNFKSWYFRPGLKGTLKSIIGYVFNKIMLNSYLKKVNFVDFDLIHSNSSVINFGALIAKRYDIKHIWHVREFGYLDYNVRHIFGNRYAIKYMYNQSNKIVFVSRAVKDYYDMNGVFTNSCQVIYNGVEVNHKLINKPRKYGTIIHFAVLGLITENKNQLIVLKAAARLLHHYKIKNFLIDIIGDGSKEYIKKLKSFVERKNLDKYVVFSGYINNEDITYEKFDIGIVPSKYEAFGRVTVEFLTQKIPVIGANSGGTPEIIKDGINGLLFDPNDYLELTEMMKQTINKPNSLKKHVDLSNQNISKVFTVENNAKEMLKLYDSVSNY